MVIATEEFVAYTGVDRLNKKKNNPLNDKKMMDYIKKINGIANQRKMNQYERYCAVEIYKKTLMKARGMPLLVRLALWYYRVFVCSIGGTCKAGKCDCEDCKKARGEC